MNVRAKMSLLSALAPIVALVAACSPSSKPATNAAAVGAADTIYFGGHLITVNDAQPSAGYVLGSDQRIDPLVALKTMTIWPAFQHFEETTKGSIEVGKIADLVILSDNP